MPAPKATDEELIEFLRDNSQRMAAEHFGLNKRTIERRIKRLALKGYAPKHDMTRTVPDGFKVKGVSSLYNKDGQLSAQWVKSTADDERRLEMLQEACVALSEELPQVDPRAAVGFHRDDLMACYPIGDPHFGEYIWAEECGKDWDLAEAERVHCGAMRALVESAPRTKKATIINLGDAAHYDSMIAVTPRSGHHLDADSRFGKMVRVLMKTIRQCIEAALEKHESVHIINVIGNHDETGAVWLSIALSHIYANEPRVTVDTSPSVFNYFTFGKCLVGMHHGHTAKADRLAAVMATDRAKEWGASEHRYWWTGHIHHESKKEYPGVVVESFNTLAPGDAYATAGGWRSRERMSCIVLHKEHGEIARHSVHPSMLK